MMFVLTLAKSADLPLSPELLKQSGGDRYPGERGGSQDRYCSLGMTPFASLRMTGCRG
jgi:hypothetical protein